MSRAPVRGVFILRPDNLGDVVLFTGALRHLRACYPEAQITLCVKRYVRNLLEQCPYVDELVSWEELHAPWPEPVRRIRGVSRLEGVVRRWRVRRRFPADVAILPVRAPSREMHETLSWIPARERYGVAGCLSNQTEAVDRAWAGIYARRVELTARQDEEHEVALTTRLLATLGIDVTAEELRPEFWTTDADRRWAAANVRRLEGAVTIGIAPGVSAPAGKAYAAERYREVIAGLGGRRVSVVVLGATADAEICQVVTESLRDLPGVCGVQNLAGCTTVRQMIEAIRLTDVVVGPDSAPLHIAIGLGRPTVTVVGGGQFGRFHPWGDPRLNRIVHRPMACFGCDWRCIYATMRCVTEIPEAEVTRALVEVLDASASDGKLPVPVEVSA